jgi:site-specific recombinase XerC
LPGDRPLSERHADVLKPGSKYGEPISNRSVQKAIKEYTAAVVSWAHVYILRTTQITEHIARRTDIKTVQGNAGHANRETTNYHARDVTEAQIPRGARRSRSTPGTSTA